MKEKYVKIIISIFLIFLFIASNSNAMKISKNFEKKVYNSLIGDIDPTIDIELIFTVQKIRAFDQLDKYSDPDFYVKLIIDEQEYMSPVWENQKVVKQEWQQNINIPDNQENVYILLQLWEKDPGKDTLCDIAKNDNNNPDRYDLLLNYSTKTGHWTGDDFISPEHNWLPDYSGYGRGSGTDDNTIYENDKDCEIWFDIKQTDSDGDNIPYWTEVNIFKTDPEVDDSKTDPDCDGITTDWEFKWGYRYYYDHSDHEWKYYWQYSPFEWNDHKNLDPDHDSIDNYEEFLTSEWFSDPYRKDIFVELDEMDSGPNGEPASILPDASKELITEAFNRQNIVFHLDDGEMGGSERIPFNNTDGVTERRECDVFYQKYFLHNDENNWKKGVFHYGLLIYNASWAGYCFRQDAFQISYQDLEEINKKLLTGPRDIIYASDYMHELGHSLGLMWLGGHEQGSGNLNNPLWIKFRPYRSVMNYAYMYGLFYRNLVDYSDGSRGKNDYDDWNNIDFTYFDR